MIVPGTADGFRTTVSTTQSLAGITGVSFNTSLPYDCCLHLLFKKLGRQMPESVLREELQALGICFHAVMWLCSWPRDQHALKDRPVTPHFIVPLARGPKMQKLRALTELSALRVLVDTYVALKAPCNVSFVSASDTCSATESMHPLALSVVRLNFSGSAEPQSSSLNLQLLVKPHSYRGCSKWKEANAALTKRTPIEHSRMSGATGRPFSLKEARAGAFC